MPWRIPNLQDKETKGKIERIVFCDMNNPLHQSIDKQYKITCFSEITSTLADHFFLLHVVVVAQSKDIFSKDKSFWQKVLQETKQNIKLILLDDKDIFEKNTSEVKNYLKDFLHLRLPSDVSPDILNRSIVNAFASLQMNLEILNLDLQQAFLVQDFQRLVDVSKALLTTKNFDDLLELILIETTKMVSCDAGSIYVVEEQGSVPMLRFKKSLLSLDSAEFILPIDNSSIAGYVVKTGKTLIIDDVYNMSEDTPYHVDTSFDKKSGYRTRSMLVIPMSNPAGDMIGAIQLINRKKSFSTVLSQEQLQTGKGVLSFDKTSFELASAMAGLASVSLENNRLMNEIQQLFEGFVKASVMAIEQRDPSTKGHSERVAALTVRLALEVHHNNNTFASQYFNEQQLREIRYASLLHDFGKVGVREKVLVKAKKLYPEELQLLQARFRYIKKVLENETQKKKIKFLKENGNKNFAEFEKKCDAELQIQWHELAQIELDILKKNESSFFAQQQDLSLKNLLDKKVDDGIEKVPYLTNQEFLSLSIERGSLTQAERKEIENHVSLTYDFLKQITWTSNLKNVPEIAHGHHEKLDGSGYPLGLQEKQISIQARMMAIADIYDAFTSTDRHYKKAVSIEETLNYLEQEAKQNKVDKDLLDLFIRKKVYIQALKKENIDNF